MTTEPTDEPTAEEIAARLQQINGACDKIMGLLTHYPPAMQFNVVLNCLAQLIIKAPNPPLVLGMATLGICQAMSMQLGYIESVDTEEPDGRQSLN